MMLLLECLTVLAATNNVDNLVAKIDSCSKEFLIWKRKEFENALDMENKRIP